MVLLVGEVSGDFLGSALMRSIQSHSTAIRFIGVGGEKMKALGFESLMEMDHLSVMGVEVIWQLPKLLCLRRKLIKQLILEKPDLVIGIDAPDFNFTVERKLKAHGIAVWHWVSPSIWAWRRGRIKKISRSCDEILCLFPDEPALYKGYPIKASFYGHPMADEIPLQTTQLKPSSYQRIKANYPIIQAWRDCSIISVLPGSRYGEVKYILPLFLQVIKKLLAINSELKFLIPIAKPSLSAFFHEQFEGVDESIKSSILLVDAKARDCMSLSDFVLLASGTATLEAMLLKKPMVVAHQGPRLNGWLLKRFIYTPYVTLPNFMENGFLIKELLFEQATVPNIVDNITQLMSNKKEQIHQIERFYVHHKRLKQQAIKQISHKVIDYLVGSE